MMKYIVNYFIAFILTAAAPAYSEAIALYTFDETEEGFYTFPDKSPYGNAVTFQFPLRLSDDNPFIEKSPGLMGTDRSATVVEIGSESPGGSVKSPKSPDLSISNQLTLEGWVRPSAFGETGAVLLEIRSEGVSSGTHFWVGYENDGLIEGFFMTHGDGQLLKTMTYLDRDVWAHIAMTYDGEMVRIYVNGKLAAERDYAEELPSKIDRIIIFGSGRGYQGTFDNFRISDRALKPEELGVHHSFTAQ